MFACVSWGWEVRRRKRRRGFRASNFRSRINSLVSGVISSLITVISSLITPVNILIIPGSSNNGLVGLKDLIPRGNLNLGNREEK